MVAEGIPGQRTHLAVVLVPVVAGVAQDQVWGAQPFSVSNHLDRRGLPGEVLTRKACTSTRVSAAPSRTPQRWRGLSARTGGGRARTATSSRIPRASRSRIVPPQPISMSSAWARQGTRSGDTRRWQGSATSCQVPLLGPGQPGRLALLEHVLKQLLVLQRVH